MPATCASARPSGQAAGSASGCGAGVARTAPRKRERRLPQSAGVGSATASGAGPGQRGGALRAPAAMASRCAAAGRQRATARSRRLPRRGAARRGARALPHRLAHGLVDLARVAKAHLDLGRVHVDVDALRRDLDEQHVDRLAAAVQHVLVGRAHRMRDELVAHEPAVDIDELLVGAGARRIRHAGAAVQGAGRPGRRRRRGCAPTNSAPSTSPIRSRSRRARQRAISLAFVPDREADLGPDMRLAAHRFDAVRQLGRVGLQELAPRRRVEEELAHFDAGAGRARRQAAARRCVRRAACACAASAVRLVTSHLGHRGDGGQRLAAKAQRRHAFELGEAGDLAGGVAAQSQRQLARRRCPGRRPRPRSARAALRRRTMMLVAPASSALSSSSRTTEAGRSTTSPAAIWLISSSGSSRIGRRRRGSITAFIAAL